MKKTCVFLASILVIFIAYACDMLPSSVELKSDKFEINAPMKLGRFNIASVLSETVKGSFPEGFEIYDMVNYPDVQAFLIGYQMELMADFNPDAYLGDIKKQMHSMNDYLVRDTDPIYQSIDIPKMTSAPISDGTWFYFDMHGFFQNMEDQINEDSVPPTEIFPLPAPHIDQEKITINLPSEFNFPPFMVFKQDGSGDNFDAAFVHTGEIAVDIALEFNGNPSPADLADLEITLRDIGLTGPIYKNPPAPETAILRSGNNYKYTIYIDIGDTEIDHDNSPRFSIGGIESVYKGALPKTFTFKLVMQPQVRNIALRGARALKIGRMEKDLPEDIIDNINMDAVDDMLNAEIASGEFRLTASPPPYVENSDETGCEGLFIGYRIFMEQQAVEFANEKFDGLNEPITKDPLSNANPSLKGKLINGNKLTINEAQSKIIIQADPNTGSTFELFDDNKYYDDGKLILPFTNKVMPITMDMGMNINELEVVRWKGDNILPPIDVDEINLANLGNGDQNISFIKSITFREIMLNVDFTVPNPPPAGHPQLTPGSGLPPELKNHIALKVSCPELGFYDNSANTKILQDGSNKFISEQRKFNVNDSNAKIKFNVELMPVINGMPAPNSPYMEFGPVKMSDTDDIKMNIYADTHIEFDWTEAEIDLKAALERAGNEMSALKGTFPEKAGNGNEKPVDLSKLSQYMSGITFGDHIAAKIFLGGPGKLIEIIKPELDFSVEWYDKHGTPQTEVMLSKHQLKVGDELPKLSAKDDDMVYLETELPDPDNGLLLEGSFSKIIADFPQDLSFTYEMVLPGADNPITVYPDTFDDVEEGGDSKIKALLVMLLPLEFIAQEGGYISIPGTIFGDNDGKDLFGRQNNNSVFPSGVNIKRVGIKINFDSSLFNGSYLRFDKDDRLFGPEGLYMGDDNSLNIILTGEQQKAINENLIYPDIKFMFPQERTLRVARYSLPVRIVIAASGSYTLNLDSLGLGN